MRYTLPIAIFLFLLSHILSGQTVQWAKQFESTSSYGQSIVADSKGNYYVLGHMDTQITLDTLTINNIAATIYLAKFNAQGRLQWVILGTNSNAFPNQLKICNNNLYMTGTYNQTFNLGNKSITNKGSQDMFIAKVDTSGKVIWLNGSISLSIPGIGYPSDAGSGYIDFDSTGALYGVFSFYGPITINNITYTSSAENQFNILIFKMDESGNFIWTKKNGDVNQTIVNSIKIVNNGNFLLGGSFFTSTTFDSYTINGTGQADLFYSLFDHNGNCLWLKTSEMNANTSYVSDIYTDSDQNIVMSILFADSIRIFGNTFKEPNVSGWYSLLLKLDSNYNLLWIKQVGTSSCELDGEVIGLDVMDNIYVAGGYCIDANMEGNQYTNSSSDNFFVNKYCSSGRLVWIQNIIGYQEISFSGGGLGGGFIINEQAYIIGGFVNQISIDTFDLAKEKPYLNNTNTFIANINTEQCSLSPGFSVIGNSCKADSLILINQNSSANFTWLFNGQQVNNKNDSLIIKADGLYTLMYKDTAACCFNNTEKTLRLNNNPDPDFTVAAKPHLCVKDSAQLIASYTQYPFYQWNKNGVSYSNQLNTQTYSSGGYSLTVRNQLGCDSTSLPKQLTFNPLPKVHLGNDTIFCNSQYKLDAGAGFVSYEWNDSIGNRFYNLQHTGTYEVMVADTNYCVGGDTIHVEIPKISLGNNIVNCEATSVDIGSNYPGGSYQWSTGQTAGEISVDTSGEYHLTYSKGSCILYDSIKVILKDKFETFIPNLVTANGDGKNDSFIIPVTGITKTVSIYNRWGDLLYQNNNYQNEWSGSELSDGVYFYMVELSSGSCSKHYKGWVELLK